MTWPEGTQEELDAGFGNGLVLRLEELRLFLNARTNGLQDKCNRAISERSKRESLDRLTEACLIAKKFCELFWDYEMEGGAVTKKKPRKAA